MYKIKDKPEITSLSGAEAIPVDKNGTDGHILLSTLLNTIIVPIQNNVANIFTILSEANTNFLLKTGGIMTGDIILAGGPYSGNEAVDAEWVNQKVNNYVPLAGGTMTGFLNLNANPIKPLHAVPLQYLQEYVGANLGISHPEDYSASGGTYPLTYNGNPISKGNSYRISGSGVVGAVTLEVGDFLVALKDLPGALAKNWMPIQANVTYATETASGLIEIATLTEVLAKTDELRAVTPYTLGQFFEENTKFKLEGTNLYNTGYSPAFSTLAEESFSVFSEGMDFIGTTKSASIASSGAISENGIVALGTRARVLDQAYTTYTESLKIFGGLATEPKLIATSFNINNDDFVCIYDSAVVSTWNMPSNPREGQMHLLKNRSAVGTGTFTLQGNGASFYLTDGTIVPSINFIEGKAAMFVYSEGGWVVLTEGITALGGGGGGVGEVNTGSNLGVGGEVFSGKVGVDLQFRQIIGGTNITVTQNANDLTIDSTLGAAITSFNVSDGGALLAISDGDTINIEGDGVLLTSTRTSNVFKIALNPSPGTAGQVLTRVGATGYEWADAGIPTNFTFTSGLSESGTVVSLGGASSPLVTDTTLYLGSNSFSISPVVSGTLVGHPTIVFDNNGDETNTFVKINKPTSIIDHGTLLEVVGGRATSSTPFVRISGELDNETEFNPLLQLVHLGPAGVSPSGYFITMYGDSSHDGNLTDQDLVFSVKANGEVGMKAYQSGTEFTSVPTGLMGINNSGHLVRVSPAGLSTFLGDPVYQNGLVESPSDVIGLGGPLVANTLITTANNSFEIGEAAYKLKISNLLGGSADLNADEKVALQTPLTSVILEDTLSRVIVKGGVNASIEVDSIARSVEMKTTKVVMTDCDRLDLPVVANYSATISPVAGTLMWDDNSKGIYVYNGTIWYRLDMTSLA